MSHTMPDAFAYPGPTSMEAWHLQPNSSIDLAVVKPTKEFAMKSTRWLIAIALFLFSGTVFGQGIIVESPVVVPAQPQVVYYPPTVSAPVVVNSPVISSRTVW